MLDFFRQLIAHFGFHFPLENPIIIFSVVLFIILLAPLLLKKLNIPGIIGLIIAGVIIGPHCLHILEGTEKSKAIALFSQIGLLYIMFIAGLDLDLNQFKNNKNKSLLFSLYTFAFPFLLGFPICYYFLDFDLNMSFLTASMFSTHTLVTYPIVKQFGVAKNKAVAVTVGGTIIADTVVLIILAVIVGNSHNSLTIDFWIRLIVSLLIFTYIMFWVIPKIAKWFFAKLESEKHSHYIFVLAVVFFAAFLSQLAGVESIVGAFIAGLALNKLIPASSALMNRIDFIGNSLFIPFFLLSVGMLVDVHLIFSGWTTWLFAGLFTFCAVFGKWIAAFFTQISFAYSKHQRQLIFGLSATHAAETLAIVLVGYQVGILNENILNGTIILILISSIIASFSTEKASKKIKIETEKIEDTSENTETSKEHILMPVDNVEKLDRLLEFGILLKDRRSQNPISVLNVVSNDEEAEVNIVKAKNRMEDLVKEASASDTNAKIITTIDHNVASGIARISKEIRADILILGWPHHAGFFNKLIGDKMHSIIDKTFKTTYICYFHKPVALHKRIVVVAPPLAEWEIGFSLWVQKIGKLSQELSNTVLLNSTKETRDAFVGVLKEKKLNTTVTFQNFKHWEDFLIISRAVTTDDLLMLIAARKGDTSYLSILDTIPSKLEKYFKENNFVVTYPQAIEEKVEDYYTDVPNEPLTKGIEVVQKIGKELGAIFKRKEEQERDED